MMIFLSKIVFFFLVVQDNVFVTVVASIQYRALADKASDAFYKLSNTKEQIQAYVFDGMLMNVCFSVYCLEERIILQNLAVFICDTAIIW